MSKTQRWLVLATVSAGLLMVSVDTTVLYTALPTLTADLHADASQKLWIINAYPLVMAGLLLGAGTLGDRIGHKRMYLTGLVLFAAASLLAAFAPWPWSARAWASSWSQPPPRSSAAPRRSAPAWPPPSSRSPTN